MSEQLTMDLPAPSEAELFEAELQARWRLNEAKIAEYWTTERRACYWAFEREDWPASLYDYERRAVVGHYETALFLAEQMDAPIRSYKTMLAGFEEDYAHKKKMADGMAAELRQAFLDRKPCPFKMEPGWEWLLSWALQLASIPVECFAENSQLA